MNEQNKAKEYLKDLREWQNKMYSPGEYLGGNLPPVLKYGNRKMVKSWARATLIIFGLLFGLALLNMVVYFINGRGLSIFNF